MAIVSLDGVGLVGLSAAVPKDQVDNLVPTGVFTEEQARAVVEKTGIRMRRIASASVCASDLCHLAADRLLNEMNIDRSTIDVLIFVSQTPDYRMPATAVLLQHRLGLTRATGAFDVNLGCSGFVYGLWMASSFCTQPAVRRVLLLNGETRTKAYSPRDRGTGLLFGDAGSAALIEKRSGTGTSFFSFNSDGRRGDFISIKSGGYRHPSSAETVEEKTYEDGSVRSDEHGVMNGPGVFEFLIEEVPADIRRILTASGATIGEIDAFVFHQANKFMNEHLRRKLRIPAEKMPYSLHEYGNTSSVSIPLTMVTQLGPMLRERRNRLLLSGFGVGLSWGSAVLSTERVHVSELAELDA